MDFEKRVKIVKKALWASLILSILIYGLILYFRYLQDKNHFEDLSLHRNAINTESRDPFTVTDEKAISGDTNQSGHGTLNNGYGIRSFENPDEVLKYTFSLAIEGKEEDFFMQFDPNVIIKDFPKPTARTEEMSQIFKTITRDEQLENIRILGKEVNIQQQHYEYTVELVYKDQVRKQIRFILAKLEDNEDGHVQWYVATPPKELVKQILK